MELLGLVFGIMFEYFGKHWMYMASIRCYKIDQKIEERFKGVLW